ncbi:hypothetical protein FA15DRAFT_666220 [Coprinopsis marcescibilis]|uniref:BTB domain-containing protein n=1 Tax=Coprinopsis marcescibilis TaxID=230819 RepID=A0A5C3L4A3_COPMA|nr:hypothetical protein FA15DRAFT_666220 [Coprinopsis marcescibilis]
MDVKSEEDIQCDSEGSIIDEKELLHPEDMQDQYERGRHRDETYYFEDGSCVLLIRDVLFNIHRTMLSKDSSTFSTIFTSGKDRHGSSLGLPEEGRSDEYPIVLTGDSPKEFRDFLWALYALPHELQSVTSPTADLSRLINIARISNKYSFKSVETWALGAIQDYVNRKPSPILCTIPSPDSYTYFARENGRDSPQAEDNTTHLTRLISLAQLCGHAPLLDTMINFLRELMSTSLNYAYLAMTLADDLDLKGLRGAAYLEVMQKSAIVKPAQIELGLRTPSATPSAGNAISVPSFAGGQFNTNAFVGAMANAVAPLGGFSNHTAAIGNTLVAPTSSITTSPTLGSNQGSARSLPITPTQKLRLLTGYYRLSATWEQLRLTPPHFDHASSCAATWHQHGCTQSWYEFWKEKTRSDPVMQHSVADVLGRMKIVQKEYDRWGSASHMHHDCRVAAKRAILEVIRKVEEGLGDYFGDDV